jgi:hypothetical protein
MKTPQDGLAAVALAPSEVAASCQGARVTVTVDADYPFGDTLTFCVQPEEPVTFPLDIRIPGWTEGAELTVEGGPAVEARSGTFHRIEREWRGETEVSLRLPMPVRAQRGFNDAVSIERGPLVYALPVKESWQVWREAEPVNDYEVYPAAPWNVALWIREDNPGASADFAEGPVGACPFSPEGAPVRGQVKGRLLPEWTIEKSAAAPPPQSPVRSEEPLIDLPLVPYGCANLRVTEFPVLEG